MSSRSPLAFAQRAPGFAVALALATLAAGCDSAADNVCGDITSCSHGGSDDWSTACRDQAAELSHEATRSGCDSAYDAYFSCAEEHFACHGNKSSFPGCEARLGALEACLDGGRASNACGELDAKLSACSPSPAPSSDEGGASLEPCASGGVCAARCYLSALADVCTPTAAELAAFADCASHCVP
jgi:hypothetical protein